MCECVNSLSLQRARLHAIKMRLIRTCHSCIQRKLTAPPRRQYRTARSMINFQCRSRRRTRQKKTLSARGWSINVFIQPEMHNESKLMNVDRHTRKKVLGSRKCCAVHHLWHSFTDASVTDAQLWLNGLHRMKGKVVAVIVKHMFANVTINFSGEHNTENAKRNKERKRERMTGSADNYASATNTLRRECCLRDAWLKWTLLLINANSFRSNLMPIQ